MVKPIHLGKSTSTSVNSKYASDFAIRLTFYCFILCKMINLRLLITYLSILFKSLINTLSSNGILIITWILNIHITMLFILKLVILHSKCLLNWYMMEIISILIFHVNFCMHIKNTKKVKCFSSMYNNYISNLLKMPIISTKSRWPYGHKVSKILILD